MDVITLEFKLSKPTVFTASAENPPKFVLFTVKTATLLTKSVVAGTISNVITSNGASYSPTV